MDSMSISGLVLVSSWVTTISLYALRIRRLRTNYHKAEQHVGGCGKSFFFVSETAVTVCWLAAATLALAAKLPAFDTHHAATSFLVGACVFSAGALTWPVVIEDYSMATLHFPHLEDAALLTTAAGATAMSGVAWHNRTDEQDSMFLVGLTTYMAFHYICVDLVGWVLVRRKIVIQKTRQALSIELIAQEWGPSAETNTVARVS